MEKLETLKNLQIFPHSITNENFYNETQLKHAAKKHIKALKLKIRQQLEIEDFWEDNCREFQAQINWITEFFNLTEEDLE